MHAYHSLSDFIDLVDQDQRILRFRLLQTLDYLAGHRAHVRSPVALDLGDVGHAADAESKVLPVQGARYWLGDGGLADTGRPVEAENLALGRALQLADGDEFCDKNSGKDGHMMESRQNSVLDVFSHLGFVFWYPPCRNDPHRECRWLAGARDSRGSLCPTVLTSASRDNFSWRCNIFFTVTLSYTSIAYGTTKVIKRKTWIYWLVECNLLEFTAVAF